MLLTKPPSTFSYFSASLQLHGDMSPVLTTSGWNIGKSARKPLCPRLQWLQRLCRRSRSQCPEASPFTLVPRLRYCSQMCLEHYQCTHHRFWSCSSQQVGLSPTPWIWPGCVTWFDPQDTAEVTPVESAFRDFRSCSCCPGSPRCKAAQVRGRETRQRRDGSPGQHTEAPARQWPEWGHRDSFPSARHPRDEHRLTFQPRRDDAKSKSLFGVVCWTAIGKRISASLGR